MRIHKARFYDFLIMLSMLCGCGDINGDTSGSVENSLRRSLLVAEYEIHLDSKLGEYRIREVWVEKDPSNAEKVIVVRLDGPHHGGTMRVGIVGLNEIDYRGIWSQRNGPPYEYWAAPNPIPESLTLEREGKRITLHKKSSPDK